MLKNLMVALAATFLMTACQQTAETTDLAPSTPSYSAPSRNFSVLFDTGRWSLSTQAANTIRDAAATYQSTRGSVVTVVGHTDTTGSESANLALSQRRAQAVTDGLVAAGVPASAINPTGTGEASLPVQTGDNVSEQRNRSVYITILADARRAGGMTDAEYCAALSDRYRQYRTSQADEATAAAMYQCTIGNTAAGIPVIEKALTDARIPLPSRA